MGEGKDGGRLPLRVGMHGVGLDTELAALQETFDDVNGLPDTRRNEVAEHSDVVVGHMPIGDGAHLSVPEMVPRQQVLLIEVVLRAVGRNRVTVASYLGQIQLQIKFDQFPLRGFQILDGEMTPVYK